MEEFKIKENEIKLNTGYYRVMLGDTQDTIAEKFNIDKSFLKAEDLSEGRIIEIRNINTKIHIVKPAETLNSIARQYNVSENQIINDNRIERLFIGMKLIIKLN